MESLGVRKGGWTREEDILLRKCVEKYGEEKWHLIPLRAGLSRCRKSCRLRWFNYLKPNIKRGKFASDEVDLMIRLHKLLGNRWSLIAGRLPGRTANDVKNYWHHHRFKKMVPIQEKGKDKAQTNSENTLIKPKPCKLFLGFTFKTTAVDASETQGSTSTELQPTLVQPNQDISWWESLFADHTIEDQELIASLLADDTASAVDTNGGGNFDFPFEMGLIGEVMI
ncbi:hypothetical protein PVL29_002428 [Vitis rotundifolia]|uniref:Uncharacterized protein n=1 Tax=Vitis rotundifolia TaxID=103349 RepID=A0AA39AGV5_VITRO|nr:hypothetical protein PVL29_002428 [Vitis rotundifolia]